jgi:NADH-quinone oxidoreductase subunit J
MTDLFFYIIAVGMIITALGVVVVRNILHAALFLVATFYGTVVLYLMLNAEFVAMTQLVVYIGGIVVVVVFTILLTSHLGETHQSTRLIRSMFSAILACGFLALFGRLIVNSHAMLAEKPGSTEEFASLSVMGHRLLSSSGNGFLLPFEIISLLLLAAIVGALVIAERPAKKQIEQGERP